ncbi:alpha-mannosidase [Paenibacillus chungangensis]|uniref:Alpha-mannosidase n=1 Tax=Paenibacillus chungangensis TaxID=696535 RepID=A0ABW3HVL0_9BACL
MTTKKTAHIISHTHWDREWYLPYEKHHVRLVELMDTLLDTMASKPDYKSFFLDGQTIILEDYLQVRPERRAELEAFIREGRIGIGPWYILQDAFLTSSEANVRNMQIGHRDAAPYGTISKIGYFPDTFGIYGQAPQLMRQAGIDNALFGRGVKPTGFNNTVSDSYESSFSELVWEGPDGSKVLGILFANWYSNGNEVPTDETEAREYWERKLADAERYASTNQLLYMNGCDHQPIQCDLPEAIEQAKRIHPEVEFIHSNFEDYLASVRGAMSGEGQLSVVKGELRSQRTDGWSTLVNTASARVYLKQMNQRGQSLLESTAEPLAAIAHRLGQSYPHHLFTYAWKTLMQNHPHDSICGCSVDEVHREMVTRFDKSRHVAESIIDDSKAVIASALRTSVFAQYGENALPFVVFNTSGWERSGVVAVELDVSRIYFREGKSIPEMNNMMKDVSLADRTLLNEQGEAVYCDVEDLGLQFGYDLPEDRFRQPYMCRRVRITFEAAAVPALGWRSFAWMQTNGTVVNGEEEALADGNHVLQNDYLRVEAQADGSLIVTDKTSGREFRDLLIFEDTGDIGNEYMYKQPNGETAITTKDKRASVKLIENTSYRAALEIVHELDIPASGDELFQQEKQEIVYFPNRESGRTTERTVPLVIRVVVSLDRSGRGVGIVVSFDNQAMDHRVRALFPSDVAASHHYADSIFEVAKRDNEPAKEWENPSNCQHQQAFVDVSNSEAGLTVANQGLHEYELLRDGRNTIAVTLLRSVSELGDWGVFPTPEAQCLGEHSFSLMLLPHGGESERFHAYERAYQFGITWQAVQTDLHEGELPACSSAIAWEGEGLAFTSMKIAEGTGDVMMRWYNMDNKPAELSVTVPEGSKEVYKSNIMEQPSDVDGASLPVRQGRTHVQAVAPFEIVTMGYR